jgi:hypothetical protein
MICAFEPVWKVISGGRGDNRLPNVTKIMVEHLAKVATEYEERLRGVPMSRDFHTDVGC